MKKGEKVIFGGVIALVVLGVVYNAIKASSYEEQDGRIPFYTTAEPQLRATAEGLLKSLNCRECHAIWTIRDPMQSVPAPALDGLGSLHDEAWFYAYLSAEDPQTIIPSRLKAQYRMPSYANLPESERRTLAAYMASLKVEDWYLEETRKREYEKLTGNVFPGKSE